MKTRFQNSRKRSHSQPGRAVGPAAAVLLARGRSRARSTGRTGPVAPACQKFSERGRPDDPLRRDADALPGRDRDLVLAEAELGVAGEDGRPEPLAGRAHVLGDELPGEVDRRRP